MTTVCLLRIILWVTTAQLLGAALIYGCIHCYEKWFALRQHTRTCAQNRTSIEPN